MPVSVAERGEGLGEFLGEALAQPTIARLPPRGVSELDAILISFVFLLLRGVTNGDDQRLVYTRQPC